MKIPRITVETIESALAGCSGEEVAEFQDKQPDFVSGIDTLLHLGIIDEGEREAAMKGAAMFALCIEEQVR